MERVKLDHYQPQKQAFVLVFWNLWALLVQKLLQKHSVKNSTTLIIMQFLFKRKVLIFFRNSVLICIIWLDQWNGYMEKLLQSFSVCNVTATSSVGSCWVRTRATSCRMCGGQCKSETGFLRGLRLSSVIINPPVFHTSGEYWLESHVKRKGIELPSPSQEIKIQLSSTVQEIVTINNLILHFSNVSTSAANVTLPHWISTDRHQMAGDVTRLNAKVLRTATRWKETPIHKIQSYRWADDI